MPRPDFICIGAIKSGTTWLHYNLQSHPEIWLPHIKELRYFNEPEYNILGRLFGKNKKRYEYWRMQVHFFLKDKRAWLNPNHVRWHLNYFLWPRSPQWYASLFDLGKGKITGDVTPLYASMPESNIAALKQDFPQTKIIYILRSPVERTWS
ncbi:MAG: sulfotransferase, partial [Elainellaceae cyanobacterium]